MTSGFIAAHVTIRARRIRGSGNGKCVKYASNCTARALSSISWSWPPGTGIWTAELVKIGERVTALDASPEMIAINRAKLQSAAVEYQQTDLFNWRPEVQYDMVFFGFWLSHVPGDKLSRFLDAVRAALKPGGRLFFVDSKGVDLAKSRAGTQDLGGEIQQRELNDGRRYEIVKIYYDPEDLTAILSAADFDIEVRVTENFFLYADGRKAE